MMLWLVVAVILLAISLDRHGRCRPESDAERTARLFAELDRFGIAADAYANHVTASPHVRARCLWCRHADANPPH